MEHHPADLGMAHVGTWAVIGDPFGAPLAPCQEVPNVRRLGVFLDPLGASIGILRTA